MKNVDNFEKFKELMNFSHPNIFYFLQIIQRNKDNNIVTSSNSKYRKVKNYYISSLEEYDRFIPEIKKFCENNNARAYVRVSPISFYDVAVNSTFEYIRRIKQNQTFKSCSVYNSCCLTTKTCGNKVWIIDLDIDDSTDWFVDKLTELGIHEHIITIFPTVNGFHFIMKPFDIRKWNTSDLKVIEIKKNNPLTLLYYNDTGSI